ncbi:cell division protein FtsQ/DivIB [Chelativorans sp. Marseille-P2723]|uniref:cell division protein FtsQ/DivIB n=1 Tax=Chelativorans sp. Marseille-P2723 TaxID=2709133 RepID=UPI001FED7799|nr:cell division protein FtsQ/DivIB [Chelativorans sp. Marseille-P2723]
MFALMSSWRASGEVRPVLPRFMRKPARMMHRLRLGAFESPPFAATGATAALFALTGLYGGLQGGHMDAVVAALTSRVGFAIEHVEVMGNVEVSEIDVLQQVGLDGWTSMVGFDVKEARQRIAELPWVEDVTVRKVYPATLDIAIVEKKPFAIWQQGSQLAVIEGNGEVIAPFSGGRHASLPMVIGRGANEKGPEFIAQVERVRGFQDRVRAYIRVADRRWDLRLDNGLTVKLPEVGAMEALQEASRLDAEYGLFSRDVTTVDMRVPGRLFVGLSPDAAKARQAVFEEMEELRKKGARI